jgi:hypothetical protein
VKVKPAGPRRGTGGFGYTARFVIATYVVGAVAEAAVGVAETSAVGAIDARGVCAATGAPPDPADWSGVGAATAVADPPLDADSPEIADVVVAVWLAFSATTPPAPVGAGADCGGAADVENDQTGPTVDTPSASWTVTRQ